MFHYCKYGRRDMDRGAAECTLRAGRKGPAIKAHWSPELTDIQAAMLGMWRQYKRGRGWLKWGEGGCCIQPALILMAGGWDRFTAGARHFSIRQQRCSHVAVFRSPGVGVCVRVREGCLEGNISRIREQIYRWLPRSGLVNKTHTRWLMAEQKWTAKPRVGNDLISQVT